MAADIYLRGRTSWWRWRPRGRLLEADEYHRKKVVVFRGIMASEEKVAEREGGIKLLEQEMGDREQDIGRRELANSEAIARLRHTGSNACRRCKHPQVIRRLL